MNESAIITKLRDDKEYYNGIGKTFLSNSDVRDLLNNPKAFKGDNEDSKALLLGRYFHQLLIEPTKSAQFLIIDASTRNTNIYKDYCKDNNVKLVLLKSETEEVVSCVQAMKGNIYFFDEIYRKGNKYEEPKIGEIDGRMWKGKCDIETPEIVIDLKTTTKIVDFKWSAKKYNYDSQAYIYEQLFGKPLVFFVADKETQQLGIFRPDRAFVAAGKEKVERAMLVYDKFYGENPTDDIENYYIDEILY
jgi:hypothetical protein